MPTCNVCGKSKSPFVMNNKTVCLRCDDLMFDIEIEMEEVAQASKPAEPTRTAQLAANLPDKK